MHVIGQILGDDHAKFDLASMQGHLDLGVQSLQVPISVGYRALRYL